MPLSIHHRLDAGNLPQGFTKDASVTSANKKYQVYTRDMTPKEETFSNS